MDATEIQNLVTQVGFPIAVCLICFWYIKKLTDEHKEEVNKLSEALNNNTIVMQKILTKLGGDENA
jgi:hypothetical protein